MLRKVDCAGFRGRETRMLRKVDCAGFRGRGTRRNRLMSLTIALLAICSDQVVVNEVRGQLACR